MKRFRVRGTKWHESFGGYDHRDGDFDWMIDASSRDVAESKAHSRVDVGWITISSIEFVANLSKSMVCEGGKRKSKKV